MERVSQPASVCPKMVIEAQTGKKLAEVFNFIEFPNGWSYRENADGTVGLYDEKNKEICSLGTQEKKLAEECLAAGMVYALKQNGRYSLYAADGKKLVGDADSITLYPNGWADVRCKEGNAFYRSDMSLAATGYVEAGLSEDEKYYWTTPDGENWSFFAGDGRKIAENFVDIQLYSPDYFMLRRADGKNVIYDVKANRQSENDYTLVELLPCKMFTALSRLNKGLALFRADGTLVQTGYDKYCVFENGMYLAMKFEENYRLYYPDGRVAMEGFCECEESKKGYLVASNGQKSLLFNPRAELAHTSEGSIYAFANGWYLCGDESLFSAMILCREDNSIVKTGLINADVYANGWYMIETPSQIKEDETVLTLYDPDGVMIAISSKPILVDEKNDCYMQTDADGLMSLRNSGGGVLLEGAEAVYTLGNLCLVEKGGESTLYLFEEKPEHDVTGKEISKHLGLTELWRGKTGTIWDEVIIAGQGDLGIC